MSQCQKTKKINLSKTITKKYKKKKHQALKNKNQIENNSKHENKSNK